jgi:hypothetical protein
MKSISTKSDSSQPAADTAVYLFDDWFDPIEAGVRDRVREFIQAMVEGELDATLMRRRYGRRPKSTSDDDDGWRKFEVGPLTQSAIVPRFYFKPGRDA